MTSFSELLQQGSANAWLFIPSAILLGALHGLEPGHSKTMMAAFIVAVRGTVGQAALLGLAATASHTAIVWMVALIGLHYSGAFTGEGSEGWFQIGSGVLIIGVALWMLWRTYREQQREHIEAGHDHGAHHDETHRIDTGHHVVLMEVFEAGVPPRFRLRFEHHGKRAAPPAAAGAGIETTRPDGSKQLFRFAARGDFLESVEEIPEPHEFTARLNLGHDGHVHSYDVEFREHAHGHDHGGLDVSAVGYQDAHEQAHANDIQQRFANRSVTTGQIVMFGLVGGLIPCPASITVLLLCLQLKKYALGLTLVLCFSIGLALTMVATGTLAALSVRAASKRFSGFGTLARRAPYLSSAIIVAMGLYTGWLGVLALAKTV
jgi:nickel/cobalt exporter